MRILSLGLALGLVACSTTATQVTTRMPGEGNAASRPNIVILYTDDQGYGDCGALNSQAKFATPNLDRLAKAGLSFTDGHCADTVCSPSRYALLTGRYSWRTRLKKGVLGADGDCLIGDEMTIASLLKAHGYRTGMVGKWHLGLQIPGVKGQRDWTRPVTDGPLQKGFDSFYGIPASMNYGVLTWFDNDRATVPASMWTRKKYPKSEITANPKDYRMAPPFEAAAKNKRDIEVAPTFADVDVLRIITERSVAFIDDAARRPEQPFFLYVPFTSPHLPHCTAAEFRGKSGMGNYGDFMMETDSRVGEILAALDRHQLTENTLVVFSSDNGPENNYRDWLRIYKHRSSGGFRGGKRDIYEGGHRIPFFLRWPAVIRPGLVDASTVCQTDLLATIAEILGTELPEDAGVDSFSFLPCLRGQQARDRAPLIHHAGNGHFAIRSGRYKLILYKPGRRRAARRRGGRSGPAEFVLYDLNTDPAETRNIVDEHPKVVARLQAEATAIVQNGRSTPGPRCPNDGPAWWPQLTWIPKPPR